MFVRRLISSLSIHRLETPKDIFKWTHSTFTFPLYSTSVLPSPLISVTRLLDYFSTFGCLHQLKFAQKYTKFAKVGSKFCQIVNKPPIIDQDFEDFATEPKFRQIWSHWRFKSRWTFVMYRIGGRIGFKSWKCLSSSHWPIVEG